MVRGDFDAVLVLSDPDIRFRKSLDDLVELFRWQRQRTAFGHRRLTLAAKRYFKIRRQHPHFVAFCLEQHVREDRNRIFSLDDALEKLQFSQEIILADN